MEPPVKKARSVKNVMEGKDTSGQEGIFVNAPQLDKVQLTDKELQDFMHNYVCYQGHSANFISTNQGRLTPYLTDPSCGPVHLRHHSEKIEPMSLSGVAGHITSTWNDRADSIYRTLKVADSMHIVNPNDFLALSAAGPCHIQEDLTVNNLLAAIGESREFPSWNNVKGDLQQVLPYFDDCATALPSLMDTMEDPRLPHFVKTFQRNVLRHQPDAKRFSPLDRFHQYMELFSKRLSNLISRGEMPQQDFFLEYVYKLMEYFSHTVGIHFSVCQKRKTYLEVNSPATPLTAILIPDLQIQLTCDTVLVGKVRTSNCNCIGSKLERAKHREVCEQQPVSPNGPEDDENSCKNARASTEEDNSETAVSHGKVTSSSDQRNKTSNAAETPKYHCRFLDAQELYKVRCYLPQLFGEMLAVLNSNEKILCLGKENENVQLGFGMDGFKLRFVRLVLRDTSKDNSKVPKVQDLLKDSRVKCDVFLTQEFNLLNKCHVTMFFQMLLVITYVCEYLQINVH